MYTVNHRMDPVPRTFTLDIKVTSPEGRVDPRFYHVPEGWGVNPRSPFLQNPEGIAVISKDLLPDNGVYVDSFTLPERIRYPARSSRDGVGADLPSQAPTLLTLCASVLGPGPLKPVTKLLPSRCSRQALK